DKKHVVMFSARRSLRFRLPASAPVARRAPDLAYSADEQPPFGPWIALSVQHAAAALTLLTYVLAAAAIGDLSASETQSLVAAACLTVALCTALQSWGGRVGAGRMLVHMPNPLLISITGLAMARYGPGSMVAVALTTSLSALAISFVLPRLRTLFPPAVAGVVICIGGLTLVGPALEHAFGLGPSAQPEPANVVIALATLLTIA